VSIDPGSFIEMLDDGAVGGQDASGSDGNDILELYIEDDATAVEVPADEFLEIDDGRGPQGAPGPPGGQIYETDDWASDPNNPVNGGTLPAGYLVVEY
jgi:hypothetical protein